MDTRLKLAPLDEQALEAYLKDLPFALIAFKAGWCDIWPQIARRLEDLAAEYPWIGFGMVDVGAAPQIARDEAVRAAGTVIAYRNGRKVEHLVVPSIPRLREVIAAHAA